MLKLFAVVRNSETNLPRQVPDTIEQLYLWLVCPAQSACFMKRATGRGDSTGGQTVEMKTAMPGEAHAKGFFMMRRIYQSLLLSLLIWGTIAISVFAQQAVPLPNQDSAKSPIQPLGQGTAPDADQSYRIGPGDLLDIRVFRRPEFSTEARVNNQGRIRLPFLEEVQVACLTEAQLTRLAEEKYKKYLREPKVDVFIKEYKSQPVAVIGAVAHPGRFQLQRRVRLLELVTFAGGTTQNVGNTIHIIRNGEVDYCIGKDELKADMEAPTVAADSKIAEAKSENPAQNLPATQNLPTQSLIAVNLRELLAGANELNVYIRPGDVVSIPEADQIFVTGSVVKPGAYALTNKVTLTQAVALAGGINMEGAKNRIRLVRPVPGTEKRKETVYNLDDILKRKVEDVALLPNDIIEVPGSTARVASRNLLGVSISMLSALPFFILR